MNTFADGALLAIMVMAIGIVGGVLGYAWGFEDGRKKTEREAMNRGYGKDDYNGKFKWWNEPEI